MLHVFSTNRVKLVARTPKAINNKGQREYIFAIWHSELSSGDFVKIRTTMQRLIIVKQRVVALGVWQHPGIPQHSNKLATFSALWQLLLARRMGQQCPFDSFFNGGEGKTMPFCALATLLEAHSWMDNRIKVCITTRKNRKYNRIKAFSHVDDMTGKKRSRQ